MMTILGCLGEVFIFMFLMLLVYHVVENQFRWIVRRVSVSSSYNFNMTALFDSPEKVSEKAWKHHRISGTVGG